MPARFPNDAGLPAGRPDPTGGPVGAAAFGGLLPEILKIAIGYPEVSAQGTGFTPARFPNDAGLPAGRPDRWKNAVRQKYRQKTQKCQKTQKILPGISPRQYFSWQRGSGTTAAGLPVYTSAGASLESPKVFTALAVSALFSSKDSFRIMSFTFMEPRY